MPHSENVFASLAARAQGGDRLAQTELRQHLEPEMIRIVRRVVQSGCSHTSMDRRILAEARRVGLDSGGATVERERLIRAVARSLSALFVDAMRIRKADSVGCIETVAC